MIKYKKTSFLRFKDKIKIYYKKYLIKSEKIATYLGVKYKNEQKLRSKERHTEINEISEKSEKKFLTSEWNLIAGILGTPAVKPCK